MDWNERISWLLIGMLVGFITGYIVRALRELRDDVKDVKEELHEVDEIVKKRLGDEGLLEYRVAANILLGIVVLVVAWSAFASQHAANESKANQQRLDVVTDCNKEYLTKTVRALNERTEFSVQQATSNVDLQKAQADFFRLLLKKPPEPETIRAEAAQHYLSSLDEFVRVSLKTAEKARAFPYPTSEQLSDCLASK